MKYESGPILDLGYSIDNTVLTSIILYDSFNFGANSSVSITYSYDETNDHLLSVSLQSNKTISYRYNQNNDLKFVKYSSGETTEYFYNDNNNFMTGTVLLDAKNQTIKKIKINYIDFCQTEIYFEPEMSRALLSYDQNFIQIETYDPGEDLKFNFKQIDNDINKILLSINDEFAFMSIYDQSLNKQIQTDGNKDQREIEYFVQNNIQLIRSIKDGNENKYYYEYDSSNKLAKSIYPDGKSEQFSYLNQSFLIEYVILWNGICVNYTYDINNRLQSRYIDSQKQLDIT